MFSFYIYGRSCSRVSHEPTFFQLFFSYAELRTLRIFLSSSIVSLHNFALVYCLDEIEIVPKAG